MEGEEGKRSSWAQLLKNQGKNGFYSIGLCCGCARIQLVEWQEKSWSCCSGIAQFLCLDSAWECLDSASIPCTIWV